MIKKNRKMIDCIPIFFKLLIVIILFPYQSTSFADYKKIDKVIAVAENDVILESDIIREIKKIKKSLALDNRQIPNDEIIINQILEKLIIQSLQLQKADKMGLYIDDQQLNDAMSNIANRNNLSLAAFKSSIEKQGESYIKVREKIRNDLIIREVQRRNIIRNLNISEQEINNFINSKKGQSLLEEEYFIEHIILPISENYEQLIWEKEEEKFLYFRDNILLKKDFSVMLDEIKTIEAEYSPLGWRKLTDIPNIFKNIIEDIAVNEVSNIITSDSGLHLIKIKDTRGNLAEKIIETNIRHILVAPNEIRSNNQAKKIIQKIYNEILEGADFGLLARQYSDDPGSALSGGDLGWAKPGSLVPFFENTMNETKIGSLSPIFETDYGWHFLEVLDRRTKDLSKERMIEKARITIAENKYEDALNNWLQELRDNSYVNIKEVGNLNI